MRIGITLAGVAVALALAPATGSARAEDRPATLKLSSGLPPHHPLNPSLMAWAESLKKATGNTVTATLFPSGRLGRAGDHHDMVRDGVADFAYVEPGEQPGRFPILAGAALPLLFADATGGTAAIDTWYRQYAAQEMKDVKFCFAFVHHPGTLHALRKVLVPGDLRGLKVRPATRSIGQLVTALGGTSVSPSAPGSRDLLARGAVDAITSPWGAIPLLGVDEVVQYHMDVPLYVTPYAWVMNKAKYERLAPAQKRAVDDHCSTEWAERVAAPWAEFESGAPARLARHGHEVYRLSPEQLKAWREASAPVQAEWADAVRKAGEDPGKVMESLKAHLARFKAAL